MFAEHVGSLPRLPNSLDRTEHLVATVVVPFIVRGPPVTLCESHGGERRNPSAPDLKKLELGTPELACQLGLEVQCCSGNWASRGGRLFFAAPTEDVLLKCPRHHPVV